MNQKNMYILSKAHFLMFSQVTGLGFCTGRGVNRCFPDPLALGVQAAKRHRWNLDHARTGVLRWRAGGSGCKVKNCDLTNVHTHVHSHARAHTHTHTHTHTHMHMSQISGSANSNDTPDSQATTAETGGYTLRLGAVPSAQAGKNVLKLLSHLALLSLLPPYTCNALGCV